MVERERPLKDRIWEFTKDISVKVGRGAKKTWRINTLRAEIQSYRMKISTKKKELGRFVYESFKSGTMSDSGYEDALNEFFTEIQAMEGEILMREKRMEEIELEGDAIGAEQAHEDYEHDAHIVEAEVVEEKVTKVSEPAADAEDKKKESKEGDTSTI